MATQIPAVYEAANVYRAVIDEGGNRLVARPLLQFGTGFTVTDEAETSQYTDRTKVVLDSTALGVLTVTPQAPLSNTGTPQNVVLEIAAASAGGRGTLSVAHFNLLDGATDAATASRLGLRDGSGGIKFVYTDLSSYLTIGATPASSGGLRLTNALALNYRNAANSGNVQALAVDNADKLLLGDGTNAAGISLSTKAANSIDFTFAANVRLSVKDALLEWAAAGTMHLKQADAAAGAGATATITTQRGALVTDQCGPLRINVGDNNTDSAQIVVTTRSLGDILTAEYKPSDLGMQLTTTKPLGLRGVALKVDPGDNGVDTTNDVTFTAPVVGDWLKLRCDNGGNGTEIDALGNALVMTSTSTTSVNSSVGVYLAIGGLEKFAVEANGAKFFGGAGGYGGGAGVIALADATGVPAGNPVGGAFLYATGGAIAGKGSFGTVTTMAPADPHCPDCGRDFAVQWENEGKGEILAVCMCCLVDTLEDLGLKVGFAFKRKLKKKVV